MVSLVVEGLKGLGLGASSIAAALASLEWSWSALAGPFLTLLAQVGVETTPLPL